MEKLNNTQVKFEVLNSDDEIITYKKVLVSKMPRKEKREKEMKSPKVKFHLFSDEDLENLHIIEMEISRKLMEKSRPNKIYNYIYLLKISLKRFFAKNYRLFN